MKWKKIGEFLKRSKIPIEIEDELEYNRVTIRINHNGVSLRDSELGKLIGTKKQFILKAGQFIVSKIDARYGAFGIAPIEVNKAIITGNFWAYDVDTDLINIDWFNQFTNSPAFYEVCERASSGITHRKYLDEKFFLNYQILLPSVEEQLIQIDKINTQKVSFGALTSELTHQLTLVRKLRQQLLQDAVQGKLVKQNPKDEPASELLKKIKAEKAQLIKLGKLKKEKELPPIKPEEIPFEISEGWIWCRLGEICNYGSSPKAEPKSLNDDTWVLDLEDIEKESSNLLCKKRFNERNSLSTKSKFNKGEVLYSKLRPYLDKVIVADEDGVCTTEILPLKLYGPLNPYYIKFTLKRIDFLKYVNSVTKGMKMPRLGTTDGQMALIPLPPITEQNRIIQKLDELMRYCNELEASIKQSESQNEKLLQQVLLEALRNKPVVVSTILV
jgi:type I restriction enzyme S subunit